MPRSSFLNTTLQQKEPAFFGEMAYSRAGTIKMEGDPGTSSSVQK